MKNVGKAVSVFVLLINILMVVALVVSAYSQYFDPEKHPALSCAGLVFPFFLLAVILFLVFWLIFRRRFSLFSFIALIICLPQIRTYIPINFHSKDVPQARIKMLSYNVMAFGNMERVNGENPILQYIAKSNADIVCMQEYATSQSKGHYVNEAYIDSMMKGYPYRDVTMVGDKFSGNKLALYSRFPILSAHRVDYKSDYNGSVCYELVIDGDTVTLINNHLESNKLTLRDREKYENMLDSLKSGVNVKAANKSLLRKFAEASALRAAQARVIAREINRSPHRTMIVCGDFNDSPLSYAHHIIAEHLTDAFTQSGCGLGTSFNRNKFYFRIDNILISSNLKSYNCTVDHSIKNSDHYPIWCYITKKSST